MIHWEPDFCSCKLEYLNNGRGQDQPVNRILNACKEHSEVPVEKISEVLLRESRTRQRGRHAIMNAESRARYNRTYDELVLDRETLRNEKKIVNDEDLRFVDPTLYARLNELRIAEENTTFTALEERNEVGGRLWEIEVHLATISKAEQDAEAVKEAPDARVKSKNVDGLRNLITSVSRAAARLTGQA